MGCGWVQLGAEGAGYFCAIGLGTTEFGITFRTAETGLHTNYAKCWDARRVQQGLYPQKGLQSY